jgi:nucleotide-binding universal stress UspA family protein
MSNIVMVGVDGSNSAFKAASQAALIAAALEAELAVLSAFVTESVESIKIGNDTWILDDAKKAQKVAERVAAELREEHPDLSIRPAAVRGKPQEALVEEAARSGARLLVVGNVGMRGLGRVLGSVASSVAHNAPCDVLIVKTDR